MNRRVVGGVLLSVMIITVSVSSWLWWKAWSAPLINVVIHPNYTVHGIVVGAPVRMQGIVIGQVSAIGLTSDANGQLRPELSLSVNPETMANRGFADRLRSQHLQEEVARGLRVHLVALSLASSQLQVELFWDPNAELPTGLAANEIPAVGAGTRQTMERWMRELTRIADLDLEKIAKELDQDLDYYYPKSDPVFAAELSTRWVNHSAAVVDATDPDALTEPLHRVAKACADLRVMTAAANKDFDLEGIAKMRKSLADATAAMDSFTTSLENSQSKISSASTEMSDLFKTVSKGAREWRRKTQALSTEPTPP
jgi:hypothetical protein